MAGEQFLLSGDQIATFSNVSMTYPDGKSNITLNGLKTLGDENSRYFLVRTQGDGETVSNGQFFAIYEAVPGPGGTLVPASKPLIAPNYATPDAYGNTAAGDDYIIFGMFGGSRFAVDLDGFSATQSSTTYAQGQDTLPGGNGELEMTEIRAANPDTAPTHTPAPAPAPAPDPTPAPAPAPVPGGDAAVCFCRGTPIRTPSGDVPVEALRIGDLVETLDNGAQRIRWISCTRVVLDGGNADLAPIRLEAEALGGGLPEREIMVSPAHRFVLRGARCELLLATDQALVSARHLVNGGSIRVASGMASVEYWHFMCDSHEIVLAAGCETESFNPGDGAIAGVDLPARAELYRLFPELRSKVARATWKSARPIARGFESRVLSAV
jgi:hypothetical protein